MGTDQELSMATTPVTQTRSTNTRKAPAIQYSPDHSSHKSTSNYSPQIRKTLQNLITQEQIENRLYLTIRWLNNIDMNHQNYIEVNLRTKN